MGRTRFGDMVVLRAITPLTRARAYTPEGNNVTMSETTESCGCSRTTTQQTAGTAPNEGTISRRNALIAGVAGGTGAVALSACGEGGSSRGSGNNNSGAGGQGPSEPTDMGAAADVPAGKAAKLTAGKVTAIVSQPQEGTFKAFSSTCTHQGCQVNVQGGAKIVCPCHNSQFSPLRRGSPRRPRRKTAGIIQGRGKKRAYLGGMSPAGYSFKTHAAPSFRCNYALDDSASNQTQP